MITRRCTQRQLCRARFRSPTLASIGGERGPCSHGEAHGCYVTLHVGGTAHLHRQAIGSLEAELDPRAFARIDRSAIVNLARVRELRRRSDGRWVARLLDGTELPVSRRRREQLLQRLGPGRAP